MAVLVKPFDDPAHGDVGDDGADHDRRDCPGPEVVQNDLQREQQTTERCVEDRADAGRTSASDEDRHLVPTKSEDVCNATTDSRADLHDRALGTRATTGANGDGTGENLFDRRAGFDEAAGAGDALHDVDDAVPFAFAADEACDDANDEPADCWDDDEQPHAAAVEEFRSSPAVKRVADEQDELVKRHRRRRRQHADEHGQRQQHRPVTDTQPNRQPVTDDPQPRGNLRNGRWFVRQFGRTIHRTNAG